MSIGLPMYNVEVLVLDEAQQLLPIGLPGEIYVGGAQLARGYLNKATLTQKAFIDHPFKQGQRLYRTGDRGKWLPNGELAFLGRVDDQVKIRGYRIELGEIEEVLRTWPEVADAVVVVLEAEEGDKKLVAYLSASSPLDIQEVRNHAQEILPAYMLPNHWVLLHALPLSAAGKVDKQQLPPIEKSTPVPSVDLALTDLEQRVAALWKTLLGVEQIAKAEDFFELGGHSLLAIQFAAEAQEKLQLTIEVDLIFDHPTLAEFCRAIEAAS